jgi:hypothetical protein
VIGLLGTVQIDRPKSALAYPLTVRSVRAPVPGLRFSMVVAGFRGPAPAVPSSGTEDPQARAFSGTRRLAIRDSAAFPPLGRA